MRNLHATLARAACAAVLCGCLADRSAGGTGVGNPTKGSVTVALVAVDSATAAAPKIPGASAKGAAGQSGSTLAAALARNLDGSFDIRDAAGTVFTVRSGYANVGRIKIALPQGMDCSDADETACESGEAKLEGPWVSDLLTGKWMPDPGSVRIPIGAYKRLLVRLEAQENAPAGVPDLGRHSLVFAGTFAYAGRPDRPFAIALDFDEDQRFESPSGFAVSEGSNSITIALDIARWLSGANLTACLDEGTLPLDAAGGFSLEKGRGCAVEQEMKDANKASGNVSVRREEIDP
jgi:hypothetical protein